MSAAQALRLMQKMKTAAAAAEHWASDAVSTYDRHVVVKQLCFTKHASHVGIAVAIIARVLQQPDTVRLSCPWVLLLCVTVARTHDPVYLEQIVRLKSSWTDLSMAVDSTLLFEFSPKAKRETAVEDTVEWVKGETDETFPYKWETGEAIRGDGPQVRGAHYLARWCEPALATATRPPSGSAAVTRRKRGS